MNNKLNNMLNDFFEKNEGLDEKNMNEKLQEFIQMYNAGEIEYQNTLLDDAYEVLEKAQNAPTKAKAIKYAKKAYKMCPECFDALLLQVHLEENSKRALELLNQGLEIEKKRLEDKNFFDKSNIGHFYTIFETRPYMRGLFTKAEYLTLIGKKRQAIDICKEILKLNENDNLGVRYLLMAIYAYLEEEKPLLQLYKKYKENSLEMLMPVFILYYKLGDEKKESQYLNKINQVNPNFVKVIKGNFKISEDLNPEYYQIGEMSEVFMYFNNYEFLIDTIPIFDFYISDNLKK